MNESRPAKPTAVSPMSHERRILLWIVVFVVFGWVVYLLSGALLPFVAGAAVAYLLDPVADRFERWGCPRGLAAFIIVAAFIVGFVLVLVLVAPAIAGQVIELIGRVPDLVNNLRGHFEDILHRAREILTTSQVRQVNTALSNYMGELAKQLGSLIGGIITGGAALLNLIGLFLIMPIVAFYLLRDWDRIVGRLDALLPEREGSSIRRIMREVDDRLSGFVRGQVLVCLLLGAWYAIGLSLVGLNFALVVGVGAGLLTIIPFVGNFLGLGTSLLIAFSQYDGWQNLALVVAVFVSGQFLEGNFVTPKIVGERVGLHPVWLIFAVTAGASVLGITGALLAVPVAAALGVFVRFLIEQYLKSPLYATPPETAEDDAPEQIAARGEDGADAIRE